MKLFMARNYPNGTLLSSGLNNQLLPRLNNLYESLLWRILYILQYYLEATLGPMNWVTNPDMVEFLEPSHSTNCHVQVWFSR
jgi:hypothetical protein